MNPDSMEFAGRRSPPQVHTEEDAQVRQAVILPVRLQQLRAIAGRVGIWLQDAIRDEPEDKRAQTILLHVTNGQVAAARALWNEQSQEFGHNVMPIPGDDEAANFAFGQGRDAYYEWILAADHALHTIPARIFEDEGPAVAQLMRARAAELEQQGHAAEAAHIRAVQQADELARNNWLAYQAQQKHLKAYYGELESQKQQQRREAGLATRNLPAPPAPRAFGAPQRQQVPKRQLGPPERVPREQPRDKQGRFTDSDSKGKGEL